MSMNEQKRALDAATLWSAETVQSKQRLAELMARRNTAIRQAKALGVSYGRLASATGLTKAAIQVIVGSRRAATPVATT